MDTDIALLLQAINQQRDDIKYIRDKVDIQGDKINDLCNRQVMTEQEVKSEISTRVKNETSKYKFITIIFSGLGGIVSAVATLKTMWH